MGNVGRRMASRRPPTRSGRLEGPVPCQPVPRATACLCRRGAAWRPHWEGVSLYAALGRNTERVNACGYSVPVGVPPCLCV